MKITVYQLHSPVSPSLPLPCVTVCHHISTGLFQRDICRHRPDLTISMSEISKRNSRTPLCPLLISVRFQAVNSANSNFSYYRPSVRQLHAVQRFANPSLVHTVTPVMCFDDVSVMKINLHMGYSVQVFLCFLSPSFQGLAHLCIRCYHHLLNILLYQRFPKCAPLITRDPRPVLRVSVDTFL